MMDQILKRTGLEGKISDSKGFKELGIGAEWRGIAPKCPIYERLVHLRPMRKTVDS